MNCVPPAVCLMENSAFIAHKIYGIYKNVACLNSNPSLVIVVHHEHKRYNRCHLYCEKYHIILPYAWGEEFLLAGNHVTACRDSLLYGFQCPLVLPKAHVFLCQREDFLQLKAFWVLLEQVLCKLYPVYDYSAVDVVLREDINKGVQSLCHIRGF